MADNIILPSSDGLGPTIALDDIGGIKYPRSKITLGADGVNDGDVSSANPLPVSIATAVPVTDNSGSLTVDNTGTFAVQATQAGTWNVTNISGTISLPTGAATSAKQPALGTAGTASTDVITVQGVASMTALKVDGSAVIQPISGTVTANAGSGTFSVSLAAGATNIAKAEDVASADSDVGVPALAVRKATPANTSGTDGDYEFLQMSAGRLWTSTVLDTAIPSGSNTIGAVNIASAQTLANVTTLGTITNVVHIDDNASSITVDGSVAATQSGVWNVTNISGTISLPTGASTAAKQPSLGTAGTASADVLTVQGIASMTALKVDGSAVTQPVSIASVPSHAVTNAGIFVTQVDGAALTALQLIDDPITTISATKVMRVAIMDAADAQITSFGGGTQYTEDAAAAADPVGNATILVRKDTPATITTTDGDNIAQRGTNYGAAYCQLVTSAGSYIDSVGGGTQYTEGDIDSTIGGTAILWEDTSDTLRAVSAAKPLPVNIVSGSSSGTEYIEGDTDATIGGTAILWEDTSDTLRAVSAAKPLPVNIISGSSSGTEYTEGDTDASITGTAILMEVGSNILQPIQGTVADGLLINLGTNNDVTVTNATAANLKAEITIASAQTLATVTTVGTITNVVHIDDNSSSISIDDGGGIITVDGTIAATQSGTWNVTNISGTISLPTGASTAAKQPALGTAGTASSDVITVQGITSMTALKVDGSAVTQPVSGTVTANAGSGTFAVSLASVPSHDVTNTGVFVTQIDGTALTRLTDIETNTDSGAVIGNGAAATAQRVTLANDSTGIISLTTSTASIGKLASNTGVTIGAVEIASAQTLATVTTVTTCSTVTTINGSSIAHDGVDSGNPHKIGARAVTSLSGLTLVAAADRTDILAGVDGAIITRPHTNLEDIVTGNATNTDGTSTQCIAAQSAGIKTYLTSIILCNSSATDITVDIKDGSTTKISFPVPGGGGVVFSLPVPLPGTAATAWNFDPSAAASTVTCSMVGFKSKV